MHGCFLSCSANSCTGAQIFQSFVELSAANGALAIGDTLTHNVSDALASQTVLNAHLVTLDSLARQTFGITDFIFGFLISRPNAVSQYLDMSWVRRLT